VSVTGDSFGIQVNEPRAGPNCILPQGLPLRLGGEHETARFIVQQCADLPRKLDGVSYLDRDRSVGSEIAHVTDISSHSGYPDCRCL
jgi:hypothetical protein